MSEQSDGERSQLRAHCFNARCEKTFESVADMVPVAGRGDRSPRHFCESCAERVRRGPPLTDGGQPDGGADQHNLPDECDKCGEQADHRVVISANHEDAMKNVRGLCDTHLKELGEWWDDD